MRILAYFISGLNVRNNYALNPDFISSGHRDGVTSRWVIRFIVSVSTARHCLAAASSAAVSGPGLARSMASVADIAAVADTPQHPFSGRLMRTRAAETAWRRWGAE